MRRQFISRYHVDDVTIDTLDSYLNLAFNKREKSVWFWPCPIYLEPFAMKYDMKKSKKESEWDKFNKYVREHYPIQYFVRNTMNSFIYDTRQRIRNSYLKFKHRLSNPHKEMRDLVFPFKKTDLCDIIITFHLQCIIDFVERKKCFEVIDWDSTKEHKKLAKLIHQHYDYAKTGRAQLVRNLDIAYALVDLSDERPYIAVYKDVLAAEKKLNDTDTKFCKWIIDNRDTFWT